MWLIQLPTKGTSRKMQEQANFLRDKHDVMLVTKPVTNSQSFL
jgi:hypothetical protein